MAKVKDAPPEEVRAIYRQHDEIESNPPSRGLFQANPPTLDSAQQDVLDRLNTRGFAVVKLSELFSPDTWLDLARDAETYTRQIEAELSGGTVKQAKPP